MRVRNKWAAGWLFVMALAGSASAAESVDTTQRILDILRDRKEISDQQYEELKKSSDNEFRVFWDKGLNFLTPNKQIHLKLGARIQNDWAAMMSDNELADQYDSVHALDTGTEFRRLRIQLEGTFYEHFDFKFEPDFANADVALKDFYLGLRNVPVVGRVRVGHFKEPFSLEQITSDSHTTFMERSLASADAFAPDRNTGIAFYRNYLSDRVLWSAGAFREADDSAKNFGGDALYNVTARATGVPWYDDDGRRLLHLGFSYSHKIRDDDSVSFNQRPEAHLATRLVSATVADADGVDLIDPEVALVIGPFSLQAEYMRAFVNGAHAAQFEGGYVYVSYFITGESRPYKLSDGAFDRPIPKRNFLDGNGGCGAWEVAARYSALDLTDGGITGGNLEDVTAGVNWYMNPYFKMMLNYVYSDHDHGDGEMHIVQARLQLDF